MHDRLRFFFVQRVDSGRHIPGGLRDRRLGHDTNAFVHTGIPEILQIRFADHGLLLEHADLGMSALGKQIRPEDRLVGVRAHRKREEPFAQRNIGSRHADARNFEALRDCFRRRDHVVGNARTEDGQASFVAEFAIGVDDGFHRSLGQALHFAVDDLDRAVNQTLLGGLLDQVERSREVLEVRPRETLGQQEVHQVADFDWLRLLSYDMRPPQPVMTGRRAHPRTLAVCARSALA